MGGRARAGGGGLLARGTCPTSHAPNSALSPQKPVASIGLGESFDVDDTDIQFVFRSLSRKRDPVTRLKMLKQLEDLFTVTTLTTLPL